MMWNGKWNGANAIVVHTPQSFRSFKRAIRSLGDVCQHADSPACW